MLSLISLIVYCFITLFNLFNFNYDWLNTVCLASTFGALALGLGLLTWHLFLIRKKISTYEYVKYLNAIQEQKENGTKGQ